MTNTACVTEAMLGPAPHCEHTKVRDPRATKSRKGTPVCRSSHHNLTLGQATWASCFTRNHLFYSPPSKIFAKLLVSVAVCSDFQADFQPVTQAQRTGCISFTVAPLQS